MSKETKELCTRIKMLKEKYHFFQKCQETNKRDYNFWDPYDGLTKELHESIYTSEIMGCRYILKNLEKEIRECRKKLKTEMRKLNEG